MRAAKSTDYILIFILIAVSFAVYANSLGGDFLIDDQAGILYNDKVHDAKGFFSNHFGFRAGALYEITYVFLWKFSGGAPYLFHLFSILYHAICVALVFILTGLLFKNRNLAFLSSLIFAIHPIHTEAVSWISGGHYVFSSLFYLAAMIFYVKSTGSLKYLFWSAVFFVLCFFAGNNVATLPVMFILYDIFFREKEVRSFKAARLIVLSGIALISISFLAMFYLGRNQFIHLIFNYRGITLAVVAAKAFVYYLKILYLPIARGLYHPFAFQTMQMQKMTPAFFLALLILALSVFSFFRFRRSFKPISVGIMWFLVTYAPFSNIIPICNIISERYLYLPSVGFSILVAALFLKAWEVINRSRESKVVMRRAAIAALTLFLSSYAGLTLKRNQEYNNIFTYWQSNINNFPDGYFVYNNLAGTFYAMGNIDNAINFSWINLMINSNQPHVWCNLGKAYRDKRDLKMARDCYGEAIKIDKHYYPAHKALAEIERQEQKKK